ncbi:hypothetical protein B296_00017938 [Ensete ventricosum]|uniref:Pre-mRNA-processing factor 19 n=1 Tax=Ensete ventricosum TaxID=4639 RepID=A0A427B4D5_ENSVE|nr:hypothetical protein B296_00017938 [Ensete ventricosum]
MRRLLSAMGKEDFIMLAAAEDELGPDGKKIRPGINPAIIAELTECNALLSGQRKKRQVTSVKFVPGNELIITGSSDKVSHMEFDSSGSYLAIAGSDVRVYQVANVKLEWNLIKIFPDLSGTGKVSCVKFGADAKYLAVGSMDRNLRIFGLTGEEAEEPKSPDH